MWSERVRGYCLSFSLIFSCWIALRKNLDKGIPEPHRWFLHVLCLTRHIQTLLHSGQDGRQGWCKGFESCVDHCCTLWPHCFWQQECGEIPTRIACNLPEAWRSLCALSFLPMANFLFKIVSKPLSGFEQNCQWLWMWRLVVGMINLGQYMSLQKNEETKHFKSVVGPLPILFRTWIYMDLYGISKNGKDNLCHICRQSKFCNDLGSSKLFNMVVAFWIDYTKC